MLTLAAMLFAAGIYSLVNMPRREDPKITIREAVVSAVYPGATAEQMENQVTRKIEERLFRFSEVRREKTFSTTRDGLVTINVELVGSVTDADDFWSRLRLDMAQLKQTGLPEGVMGPVVDSDFGDTSAVLIAVHGNGYGPRELKDYAQRVEDRLRTIKALSKIKRIGDQEEEIDLEAASGQLAQYAVDPRRIQQALNGRNTVAFAGRVPASADKPTIESNGSYKTEDEIRRTVVAVSPQTGQPVHVGDLAQVNRVYKDPSEYVRYMGEPSILLSVEMSEGHNIVRFGKDVRAALDELRGQMPPEVKLDLVADQPQVVHDRIFAFFREFGIAIVAVILVTMLLLPLRVALVSAVAIPVTVSITFAALNILHIELQQVSIAALIVVLGMVVDDAIVIADNYVELLDRKTGVEKASWLCATQMSVPVLTATLTIIGSFLPMMMLSGAVGEFIRALPIAVAVALSSSFVVAMLLTPLTAKFFIRQGLRDHEAEEAGHKRKPTLLDRMQHYYNLTITWAMRHKRPVLAGGVITFIVGVLILKTVPEQFFPLAERDQFVMDVWLQEGAKIESTDAAVKRIETVLKSEKDVRSYASFLGESAPRFYYNVSPQPPASNYAQIVVNTRSVSATPKLVEALRERMGDMAPEARVYVKELQQGQVMEAPVEVRIVGTDLTALRTTGKQVENILEHTKGATYISTDWHEDAPRLGLNVHEEVASRLGLTDDAIAQQLAGSFEGAPLTTYWDGDRPVDVVLRVDHDMRQNYDDAGNTYIGSPVTGARVPVSAVATLQPEWRESRIVRRNGVRTLTVRAFPEKGMLASKILSSVQKQIKTLDLPAGCHIEYGGEKENQDETFGEMVQALMLGLLLIFLILLFQFRTLADPLVVMMAFPLALPGAALGLLVTGNPFGFTAFIGILSLGGLAVRNSIILVDYIYERIKAGVELEQAALEAGERRLRPIFLTSMAAAVGVLPMILSGSSLWSPLGSAIAFGLIGSMFCTLVVIPVLFVAAHGEQSKALIARWQRKLMDRFGHGAAGTAAMLALAALLLTPHAMRAETRHITLDEAVKLASQQNPQVKMARLKAKEAEARVTQARANYFPVVTDEGSAVHAGELEKLTIPAGSLGEYSSTGPIPGKNIDIQLGKQDFFLNTLTAAQPLTQLFKIHAGVGFAQAEAGEARAQAARAENEVALKTKQLYWGLLAAQERKRAAELRIAAGEGRLAEARTAVEAGAALKLKALDGQAQIAEARHKLGQLEDTIADMQADLADLTGLAAGTEVELETPDAKAQDSEDRYLIALANEHNPEITAAKQTLAKAHAGLNSARAEFIPEISAYAEYVYQNGVPLLSENNAVFGLKLSWTLSEFGKRTGQVRERQAQVGEAKINLQHTEDRVRIDMEKELRKVARAADGLKAAQDAVAARAEMRRITADQVEAKTATAPALQEAEAGLAEAQAELFSARMDQATAQAELARTAGVE
jgi:multidrug efflux pump subunit AcrB/outer membrane protein TolC